MNPFEEMLQRMRAVYGFSSEVQYCLGVGNRSFKEILETQQNQEMHVNYGRDGKVHAATTLGDAISRTAQDGLDAQSLYSMCVVFLYAIWEHGIRPKVARALEVEANTIAHPGLGDLRKIRQAIVHAGGKLDKILEHFSLFSKGDMIEFSERTFHEFGCELYKCIVALADEKGFPVALRDLDQPLLIMPQKA